MKALVFSAVLFFAWIPAAMAQIYAGLDANRYSISLKSSDPQLYPQSVGGIGLHLGDRFGNLAGEIGYDTSTASGNGYYDNLHLTRLTADGFFYIPIAGGFNLLLTGGGAETNYGISSYSRNYYTIGTEEKSTNADVTVVNGNEFDWRAGGGFSFGLDEFELRVIGRYQPLSMQQQAQSALSVDLALNMYF